MKWKFLGREAKSETVRNVAFNTLTLNNQGGKKNPRHRTAPSSPSPRVRFAVGATQITPVLVPQVSGKLPPPGPRPLYFSLFALTFARDIKSSDLKTSMRSRQLLCWKESRQLGGSARRKPAHPGERLAGISLPRYRGSPCPAGDLLGDAAANKNL